MLTSTKIRKTFLDFFKDKRHTYLSHAPLVNKEDPTLLFTNAGMNQFKHLFLEHQEALHQRVVNTQPCLRVSGKHNDLEEVGIDNYHHTLFEMMGTWSFGDYFKQQAIEWAWELLTEVYKIPIDRIYVTIFGGDQKENLPVDTDSLAIWHRYIHHERILLGGKKDNFWEMGHSGPCGTCSEIHVDIRSLEEIKSLSGKTLVNQSHPQVIEIWNLVFIEYNRHTNGSLTALSAKHIDTGMGLERLTMILQGKQSTYDTDLFIPLIHNIMRLSQKAYGRDAKTDTAMRVVADHVRAVTFAIAEGQLPGNTEAGYVIKRILRRAVRYGYTILGFTEPFMYKLVSILAQQFQYVYPHLKKEQDYVEEIIKSEEEAFLKVLTMNLHRVEQLAETLIKKGERVIEGAIAFELYDTHGFPLDVIQMVAEEKGLKVDEKGFQEALAAQRKCSKQAINLVPEDWQILKEQASHRFVGYDQLQVETKMISYRPIQRKGKTWYQLVLEESPFYPEGGGQVGDTGQLIFGQEVITVLDTRKEEDRIVHYVTQFPANPYAIVKAIVDEHRRKLIANNHTATHLLQAALREVVGKHVEQRGSLVTPDFLRFDFSHSAKVEIPQLRMIEKLVNQKIRDNIVIQEERSLSLEAAKKLGVMALFGEKYGETVRMITCDSNFSRELCGGTHANNTGNLGFFKIVTENAVAAGTRRIEAVTAQGAEEFVEKQRSVLSKLSTILHQPQDPVKALQYVLAQKAELEKNLQVYQKQVLDTITKQLFTTIKDIKGISVILQPVAIVPNMVALKQLAINLRTYTVPLFGVLVATIDGKPSIAISIADALVQTTSLNANKIIKILATHIAGEGGGQSFLATAQGKDTKGLQHVLTAAQSLIENMLQEP